jgi:hypothetical protein
MFSEDIWVPTCDSALHRKILRVDFVHLRKVRHVGNEDVYFDNMLERAARGFENVCQVLQDLMLQQICID